MSHPAGPPTLAGPRGPSRAAGPQEADPGRPGVRLQNQPRGNGRSWGPGEPDAAALRGREGKAAWPPVRAPQSRSEKTICPGSQACRTLLPPPPSLHSLPLHISRNYTERRDTHKHFIRTTAFLRPEGSIVLEPICLGLDNPMDGRAW